MLIIKILAYILKKLILGRYFRVFLKVINDLIEQRLADPVEVDVTAYRCPPEVEMAYWLLKAHRFLI